MPEYFFTPLSCKSMGTIAPAKNGYRFVVKHSVHLHMIISDFNYISYLLILLNNIAIPVPFNSYFF